MLTHAKFWRWLVALFASLLVTQVVATSMATAHLITAADNGRDLSTLVAGGSILDQVQATFTDANDQPIPQDQVTTTSKMQLVYDWSIPDNVAKAGDTFQFDLPKNFILTTGYQVPLNESNGTSFGECVITQAGHVTFTFNQNVQMSGVKGQFMVTSNQLKFDSLGHQDILVPLAKDQTTTVPITVIPNHRVDIAKAAGKQVGTSDEIDWKLGVNNMSLPMNDAVIDEQLPASLKLVGVSIETATAGPDADATSVSGWTGTGHQLAENRDFEVVDNRIQLIGDYANTNSPLLVTVKTKLADPSQPLNGEDITNSVSLSWHGAQMPPTPPTAHNQVNISYVPKKWLQKDFLGQGADAHHYRWKVQYNQDSQALAAGTKLTDTLGAGQRFLTDQSDHLKLATGRFWPGSPSLDEQLTLQPGTDYDVSVDGDQMVVTLKKALSEPLILTYDVYVDAPTNGQVLENTVNDDKGHHVSNTGRIDTTPQVTKTVSGSDPAAHHISYTVDLNASKQPLTDLVLTDKMSSNDATHSQASLLADTLKLVDQTTNQTLVEGTDYTLTLSGNQFVLKLIGHYAQTSDHFQLTYTVGYDPAAGSDTIWTNTLTGPNINTHVDWHPNPPDQPGDKTTPPTKKGIWEATQNRLRWDIVVNQDQHALNGATVTDTIDANQAFDSVALYETHKGDDDKWKMDAQISDVAYDLTNDRHDLTVHLPDSAKTYLIIVRTKRVDPLAQINYHDTANFNHGKVTETTQPATIYPADSGEILAKTGQVSKANGNQVDWQVTINKTLAHLTNVVLTDVASANQSVDADSFAIYPLVMNPDNYNDGRAEPDKNAPLKRGLDYELVPHVDGETGKTTTVIRFDHDIDQAYLISYHSTLIGASGNVSNHVALTADQVTGTNTSTECTVPVSGAGATVEGTPGVFTVTKTGPGGEKLAGAEFSLTPVGGGKARIVTTDANGLAKWQNLYTGTYYLKETKAPAGYQIAPDYQGLGRKIDLTFKTGATTQAITVVNEKAILPHTGGWQRAIALLIGMLLLALAGGLIGWRKWKAGERI